MWKDVIQEFTNGNFNQPTFYTENEAVEGHWWVFPARLRAGSSSVKECYWFKTMYSFNSLQAGARFQTGVHWLGENTAFITENETTQTRTLSAGLDYSSSTLLLIGGSNIKFFEIKVSRGNAVVMDFVPALRNSDGVPGMYDKVNKTFFGNQGSGTFGYRITRTGEVVSPAAYSLRDPWRVAPSGVWARLAADGTLDAVAETELDTEQAEAQGYAYFANTADAAEVLGATEQETI